MTSAEMMSAEQLKELSDWLAGEEACNFRDEGGRTVWTCDRTLRFTEQWLAAHDLSADVNIPLLFASSAYCDCEVVINIDTIVEEMGWPPQEEMVDMVLEDYDPEDRAVVLEAYKRR